ncbi:XkdX family protein [Bacillus atrophaeus]|uniref:XkdX family protein n=1 Tax=Bacillus atrophaeus TaxID=1452 RepID=UPI002E1A7356|nr:XkdX family protein [Bacillus atrophaeus]
MDNFWVIALSKNWATVSQVKEAYSFNDVTKEELQDGVKDNMVTPEEYEEITGEKYELEQAK